MKIELKHRWNGSILFSIEASSLKLALEAAVQQGAHLEGADLKGADLKGAHLEGAYLKGAYLEGAYLKGAYLKGADLEGADLEGAYLKGPKEDFWKVLGSAPHEVDGLRKAMVDGRIDGSTYEGECACLVGTIANVRQASYDNLGNGISPNSGRPAEQWFMSIKKGDTPETNNVSKITVEWIDEFQQLLSFVRAA